MRIALLTLFLLSFSQVTLPQVSAETGIVFSSTKSKKAARNSKFKKFTYAKAGFVKAQGKRNKSPVVANAISNGTDVSNSRPSRSYKSRGISAQVCGGDGIFNSYDGYLDCADLAVVECNSRPVDDRDFCIYERCGNTPDNFETLWRDLSSEVPATSVSRQYYKNDFGSSGYGSDTFNVSLHPCLIDGAGRFVTNSGASATVMGSSYTLGTGILQLFHPGKAENQNLSSGSARLAFNFDNLVTIKRDDFGSTTVPFTFKQEVFKSFPKSADSANRVYWVDNVIPVNMIFRPQGVVGIEISARVSPEARALEVNFAGYNDFGTSADAGAARDGVGRNTSSGIISLVQTEYRTNKFIQMNADESSMLPSLTELSQLEYWPPKGGFKPICAQWFASATTHPEYGYRCSDLVDFGPLNERKGTVATSRDGTDRIIFYLDRSSGGDDGELKPFPYRNPILDDF